MSELFIPYQIHLQNLTVKKKEISFSRKSQKKKYIYLILLTMSEQILDNIPIIFRYIDDHISMFAGVEENARG